MNLLAALLLTYLVGLVVTWRLLAGHLAWKFHTDRCYPGKKPAGERWTEGILAGACLAVAWPVVAVGLLPWKIGAEKEAAQRAKAERLRELEREAGIV